MDVQTREWWRRSQASPFLKPSQQGNICEPLQWNREVLGLTTCLFGNHFCANHLPFLRGVDLFFHENTRAASFSRLHLPKLLACDSSPQVKAIHDGHGTGTADEERQTAFLCGMEPEKLEYRGITCKINSPHARYALWTFDPCPACTLSSINTKSVAFPLSPVCECIYGVTQSGGDELAAHTPDSNGQHRYQASFCKACWWADRLSRVCGRRGTLKSGGLGGLAYLTGAPLSYMLKRE